MHVLIAPNAFKHALTAQQAALAIQAGLEASKLTCTCECFPIGDGGNGTGELILDRLGGYSVEVRVDDPLGRPVTASFGLIADGQTAVIEMAHASGLHLLKQNELNPLRTNSFGTGQLMKAAMDRGVRKIIIGMGGSATVDGGSGILAALGVRFLDAAGATITDLPFGLSRLHSLDCTSMDGRLADCEITVLCDVDNPLLGKNGAAAVFGPQKGATPEMVGALEERLRQFAAVVESVTGHNIADFPSGGVAGGASAGLVGILNAKLANGIDYFLQLTHFDDSLSKSQLVITGEGSIDSQTLRGKGPYGVAKSARQMGVPVLGLAGGVPVQIADELNAYFDGLMPIGNAPTSLAEALPLTGINLTRTALQLGNLIAALGIK
ncbi:glycerate kinase [Parapedobacter sp. GCM10030251]|uniref:glycerate kinase n=1 Tax=Parapedobacter sp. GCM10030251 TaxID=3273419 RepID=UPI003621E681